MKEKNLKFIDKMEKEIRDAESQQQINRVKMVEPMRAKSRSRSRSRDREEEQQLKRASELLAQDRGYTPEVGKKCSTEAKIFKICYDRRKNTKTSS